MRWIVAEEFLDTGRAKLVKAGEQQIAIAELEGRDSQHGLRLVGQASGALMNKGLTLRTAQQHGQRYIPQLFDHVA